MTQIKRILLMVQFLTTIPIPLRLDVKEEDFGKGLIFAPVIGFILGALLLAGYILFSYLFPHNVALILMMILYILLTGGLHLDGLGDTFDGLFSNRSKERILEIMRDSRMGTNGVLAIVSVLMLNGILLVSIPEKQIQLALLLLPAAGRIGSLVGAGFSKYARSGEGLGKSFIDICNPSHVAVGSLLFLAIAYLEAGLWGLALGGLCIVSAWVLIKLLSIKLDGATGDILGAVCELNQTIFLMAVLILWGKIL